MRVLSICGGGIKGVIPAMMLSRLENETGIPLHQQFDLVVGSSTGGLLALAIGAGMPAKEIVDLYFNEGPRIFSRQWHSYFGLTGSKYSLGQFQSILDVCFRGDTVKSGIDNRTGLKVAVTTTRVWDRSLILLRSWEENTRQLPMSLVGSATSAAPTYFDAVHIPNVGDVVDGGISANSPSLVAWMEARKLKGAEERVTLLELTCSPVKSINKFGSGLFSWADKLVPAFMDAGMDKDRYVLSHVIGFGDYLRLGPASMAQASYDMDDVSSDNMQALYEVGSYASIEHYSSMLAFVRNSTMKFPRLGR